jgi:hypothetical protein
MGRLEDLHRVLRGELPLPPVGTLLGVRVTHVEEGVAVIEMTGASQLGNVSGVVQGELLASLADIAIGAAVASTCTDVESRTTLELKIGFLRRCGPTAFRSQRRLAPYTEPDSSPSRRPTWQSEMRRSRSCRRHSLFGHSDLIAVVGDQWNPTSGQ